LEGGGGTGWRIVSGKHNIGGRKDGNNESRAPKKSGEAGKKVPMCWRVEGWGVRVNLWQGGGGKRWGQKIFEKPRRGRCMNGSQEGQGPGSCKYREHRELSTYPGL